MEKHILEGLIGATKQLEAAHVARHIYAPSLARHIEDVYVAEWLFERVLFDVLDGAGCIRRVNWLAAEGENALALAAYRVARRLGMGVKQAWDLLDEAGRATVRQHIERRAERRDYQAEVACLTSLEYLKGTVWDFSD